MVCNVFYTLLCHEHAKLLRHFFPMQATNLMAESGKAPTNKLWDAMPPDTGFLSSAIHKSPVIPKTVDYGHGHGKDIQRTFWKLL